MFQITGEYVGEERKSGEFTPDGETSPRPYDFTIVKVLVGAEVIPVRLPKGVHVHPFQPRESVTLNVSVPPRTRLTTDFASLGLGQDVAPDLAVAG